ncbi:SDR family NAD(P)-dependent oxidoreductase [Spirillospora sp. CA-255316]
MVTDGTARVDGPARLAGEGRFDGRVALVTGAAGGIGAATARLLASQGARVVLADRDGEHARAHAESIIADGGDAVAATCDQTDPDQVGRLFADTIGERLDICVANAGYGRFGSVLTQDLATWRRHVDVNLTGTFLICQAAARAMARRRGGAIVINASTAALRSCTLFAAYAATKAGVEMFARCLADELGPLGIRVNTVCPGVTDTGMTTGLLSDNGIRTVVETETPLTRVGTPEDVARAIAFLAGDDAGFITGSALLVDGGQTLRGYPRWFVPDTRADTEPAQWRLLTAPPSGTTPVAPLSPPSTPVR